MEKNILTEKEKKYREIYKVTITLTRGSLDFNFETMKDVDNFIHSLKFPNTIVTHFPNELDDNIKVCEKILIYTNQIVTIAVQKIEKNIHKE